jgi:acid phosphatase family membrane protein YuiD
MSGFWGNAALWIPVSVALGVQVYKFAREWLARGDFDLRVLARSGGMPSSHSAMVTSLVTVTGLRQGFDSEIFAVAVVLAMIVMYDASGVRQAAGQQAKVLNQILRELFSGQPVSEKELKELIGHTPVEVLVGAGIGILYAWLWLYVPEFLSNYL